MFRTPRRHLGRSSPVFRFARCTQARGGSLDKTEKGTEEEATIAASLIGALNLPNARLVPLILGTR